MSVCKYDCSYYYWSLYCNFTIVMIRKYLKSDKSWSIVWIFAMAPNFSYFVSSIWAQLKPHLRWSYRKSRDRKLPWPEAKKNAGNGDVTSGSSTASLHRKCGLICAHILFLYNKKKSLFLCQIAIVANNWFFMLLVTLTSRLALNTLHSLVIAVQAHQLSSGRFFL